MPRVVITPALPDRAALDHEIAHLRGLDIGGLRARWHTVMRRPAPPHLPRHLLFRILAYRLQADRCGGALAGYASNDIANRADLKSVISYYEVMAKKLGIELRLGIVVDPRLMRDMLHTYDMAVIAAGTALERTALPPVEDGREILDAVDVALGRAKAAGSVVVLGGGKVGLTISESLATQGHRVTIVELEKRIAGDVLPSFKWRHTSWVDELKIQVFASAQVRKVAADGVHIVDGKGGPRILAADTVIVASHRKPNNTLMSDFEWMIDELYSCGDAVLPRGLGPAIHDGYRLGCRV